MGKKEKKLMRIAFSITIVLLEMHYGWLDKNHFGQDCWLLFANKEHMYL